MSDPARLLTYLGPEGSFTHAAVDLLDTPWTGTVQPRLSIADVIFSVESGEAAAGVVPLETSVEGDVTSTIDELIFRASVCFINEELVVPVSYVVAGAAGARVDRIDTLVSTTTAIAQCRRFVESTDARVVLVESTGAACERVVADDDPRTAALTNAKSAGMHGLAVLRGVAEDHSGIRTRMALLGPTIPPPSGNDKTALVITPVGDRTGVLADILECFSSRDIALTSISSRPLKTRQGEYSFLLTARGHLADERLQEALVAAAELPADVKLLGSYPMGPSQDVARVTESAPPGSVDAGTLPAWIRTLLAGGVPVPGAHG